MMGRVLIRIDPTDGTPLADQLAASIRHGIITGDIVPGERLPAARSLAASLDVNMHTVLRAYAALRDEGTLEVRRGRGAIVTERRPEHTEVDDLIRRLHDVGRRLGLSPDQLAQRVQHYPRAGGAS